MSLCTLFCFVSFFFFNATPTTEIYTLSLHDALPIHAHAHAMVVGALAGRDLGDTLPRDAALVEPPSAPEAAVRSPLRRRRRGVGPRPAATLLDGAIQPRQQLLLRERAQHLPLHLPA